MASVNLGLDLQFVQPADSRSTIISACIKCWFAQGPNGLRNYGDCSGFLKSVQAELLIPPFTGDANSIAGEVYGDTNWAVLGIGSKAAAAAGDAANAGRFVIAAWKAQPGHSGHVAIITTRLSFLGRKPEQQDTGAWGQLGGSGELLGQMSKSFGANKHNEIVYAACNTIIMPRPFGGSVGSGSSGGGGSW